MGVACSQPPENPPPAPDTDAQSHLGGSGPTGTGSEASTNPCVAAGGVCMDPGEGNICPSQTADPCTTSSDEDASGTFALVCCTGFNDAGAPSDVFEGG
jgi:hypothetical protein